MEISESGNHIIVKVNMPGVNMNDIELVIKENSISIKAEKKTFEEEKKKGLYREESSYKGYNFYSVLPAKVAPATAHSVYENGIFTVVVEKAEEEKEKKGKKIKVKK
jgi:HSP20 family protein